MYWVLLLGVCAAAALVYIWHANRAIHDIPPEPLKLVEKPWTDDEIKFAYKNAQTSPTDVRPFLFAKQGRRYIVCGGSGSVGGWIAAHLLMRGEDPAAIRILDLNAPTRDDLAGVAYSKVDVTDKDSVSKAFDAPWPESVSSLELTVFHTVAFISPAHRNLVFLSPYRKVNLDGTRNVLNAAKSAGAACFIATSSASVGITPPSYWPWPWQRHTNTIYQFVPNAEPKNLHAGPESFGSCYAWTKAQAELLVRGSNTPTFRTGVIRPGHAIYGHGVEQTSSLTWDYLQRGGAPTWIPTCVSNVVNTQNVSIGHLAFEHTLLKADNKVGGNAYCVCDPGPPIRYRELYRSLTLLAHPSTPVQFQEVPAFPILLIAYLVEAYDLLRVKYIAALPRITGDFAVLTPAMFNMSTLHLVYTDTRAREEIGYRAPITTREGFALAVKDWNGKVEAKLARERNPRKAVEEMQGEEGVVPKAPSAM